jgi:hypothetical protein
VPRQLRLLPSVLMHHLKDGRFVISHIERGQWAAYERERQIKQWADDDSKVYVSTSPQVLGCLPRAGGAKHPAQSPLWCCSLGKPIRLSNAFSFSLRLCLAVLSIRSCFGVELAHACLRTVLAAKPDRPAPQQIAHHDPIGVTLTDRDLVNAYHLR